jgi:hypothetical protein
MVVGHRTQLLVRAGTFYSSENAMDAWAYNADVGARLALGGTLVGELDAGYRNVNADSDWAARAAASARLAPWLTLDVETGRDDVYWWAYRVGSLIDRVSGEYAHVRSEARLPHAITLEAEVTGRVIDPSADNSGIEGSLQGMIALGHGVSAGVRGEAQAWSYDSGDYWSPLAYWATLAIAEYEHEFAHPHLQLSAEAGGGVAYERVTIGTYLGPTFEGAVDLHYHLTGRIDLLVTASYLHSLPRYEQGTAEGMDPPAYWETRETLSARFTL